jgi:hypothetical protein
MVARMNLFAEELGKPVSSLPLTIIAVQKINLIRIRSPHFV